MKGEVVTIHYRMDKGITIGSMATQNPVLLDDGTDNVYVIMPMIV